MPRLRESSGGGGGIDASDFIDEDNSIEYAKLLSTIVGAFVTLWTAVWLEAFDLFVSIHVWIIDGVGRFLESVVLDVLGGSAAVQTAAWREAFVSLSSTPMAIPFVFAIEAFILYGAFAWLRGKGVVP